MHPQKLSGSGNFFYVATQRGVQRICDQNS